MPAIETPPQNPPYSDPPPDKQFEIRSSVRLHAAFHEFLKAYEYARDLQTSVWDFAVELPCLRRLQATNSDLRWLAASGLVEHALETTSSGDSARNFKRLPRLIFSKRTCFVLTPKGAEKCRSIWGSEEDVFERRADPLFDPPMLAIAAPSKFLTPKWDRDRQELRVGSTVVKRFRVPASSQEAILAAFEEESWPPRIDDPLPPRSEQSPKRRLQETIKSLNRNQRRSLIRFSGDGNAQGVLWEFAGEEDWTIDHA
jgi:hypothetical protein